jgi:hypothetical protein
MATVAATQQDPVANVPGGGAEKTQKTTKASPQKKVVSPPAPPADPLYTTAKPEEKGTVDEARVTKLKANKKRPAPLKRTAKIKLDKESKQKLKESRKAAAAKFKERSESTKKDLSYRKKFLEREAKRKKSLEAVAKPASRKMTNCSVLYSVGPQPKYKTISKRFREFRKFSKAQLECSTDKKEEITVIYKVGQPIKSA